MERRNNSLFYLMYDFHKHVYTMDINDIANSFLNYDFSEDVSYMKDEWIRQKIIEKYEEVILNTDLGINASRHLCNIIKMIEASYNCYDADDRIEKISRHILENYKDIDINVFWQCRIGESAADDIVNNKYSKNAFSSIIGSFIIPIFNEIDIEENNGYVIKVKEKDNTIIYLASDKIELREKIKECNEKGLEWEYKILIDNIVNIYKDYGDFEFEEFIRPGIFRHSINIFQSFRNASSIANSISRKLANISDEEISELIKSLSVSYSGNDEIENINDTNYVLFQMIENIIKQIYEELKEASKMI